MSVAWATRASGGSTYRDYGIVFAFVALFIALSFASSAFLKFQNMSNILDQWAAIGLLACGETICIIAGVFDLSVGRQRQRLRASSPARSRTRRRRRSASLAGAADGPRPRDRERDRDRPNPDQLVHRHARHEHRLLGGLAIIITGGLIRHRAEPRFGALGQDSLFRITYPGWFFIVFAIVTAFVLGRTTFGRYVYAVGGNAEAARLSGVRVGRDPGRLLRHLGPRRRASPAMLLASRTQSAAADLGSGMELTAISAAVVGGTSILGGEGAIWRGVLGTLLLAIIGNGFNLLNIDTTYQQIVQGGLILVAVAADQLARRR